MTKKNPHIEDETFLARWLAGELSEEESEQFENSEEYQDFLQISTMTNSFTLPAYETEAELSRFKDRIYTPKKAAPIRSISRTKFFSIAAMFCLIALTGIYLIFFNTSNVTVYETAYGETQSITLPDGSTVILNAGSSLQFSKNDWDENRTVDLDGEAFFKVETGNTFDVQTSLGTISVLGTEFNVKNRGTVLTTACFEGSVIVNTSNIERILSAGEQVQIEEGEIIDERELANQNQPSWMAGIVTLTNVPILVALKELESQFGISVIGTLPSNNLRFTGSFPTTNASSAVRLVLEPFDISYNYDANTKQLIIE